MTLLERVTRSPLLLALLFVVAALLGAGLFAGLQTLFAGGVAGTERARIESVVRDYVLEHPEILPEAMERLRDRETGKAVAANRAAIVEPFASAWAGNPKGDVTVAVYMDYACGYCRASLPAIAKLLESDPRVRVVYRELPVLSEESGVAARWALAAAEQGKFKPFHDALYAAGQLSPEAITQAAATAGLDKSRAAATIDTQKVTEEIARNQRTASQLGFTGTPSWVIGDKVIYGAVDYDELVKAVARAREKG